MRQLWGGHFKGIDTLAHRSPLLCTSPFVPLVLNYGLPPSVFQSRINLSLMVVLFLSTIIITGNSHLVVINVIIVGQGRALRLEICALEPPDELRTCFSISCMSQAAGLRP